MNAASAIVMAAAMSGSRGVALGAVQGGSPAAEEARAFVEEAERRLLAGLAALGERERVLERLVLSLAG